MRARLLLAMVVVVTPMVVSAVTLSGVVQVVLNTNPVIQERVKYFRSVKQDVDIAKSGYYPKLDLVAGVGREKSTNVSTLFNDVYLNRQEVGVVLSQNLFEGLGTQNNIKKQLARVDSAAYSVLEKANKISLSMIEAYTKLFKEKALLALAKKNIETHKKIDKMIQDRINSGVGAKSELEQSSSRLALAQSNLLTQINNYEDALNGFIKIYGHNINPADLVEPPKVDSLPNSKAIALADANLENPSLKVQRPNMRVARDNYKLAEKDFSPKVDLELRQDWNRNIGGVVGKSDSSSIMLKFRWNLYNGGADKANKQKTVSEFQQESQSYQDLVRRVNESVGLSWSAYTLLGKQIGYQKTHKELSVKTLASYYEEFNLGRRTLLDILDTEEALYTANRDLVTTEYDEIFAQYRVLNSIGTLYSYIDSKYANIVGFGDEKKSKANVLDVLDVLAKINK